MEPLLVKRKNPGCTTWICGAILSMNSLWCQILLEQKKLLVTWTKLSSATSGWQLMQLKKENACGAWCPNITILLKWHIKGFFESKICLDLWFRRLYWETELGASCMRGVSSFHVPFLMDEKYSIFQSITLAVKAWMVEKRFWALVG